MKLARTALLLLCLGIFSSCGRDQDLDRESTSGSDPENIGDAESLALAEKAAVKLLGPQGEVYRAAWDQLPSGESWSKVVLAEFRSRKSSLEQAKDLPEFCPDYDSASTSQKETCWLRIISAMAFFESSLKSRATYKEKAGTLSIGLLMMNADHCPSANTEEALKDGEKNIRCAFARMDRLIKRDQFISGPGNTRGAAAYWSVLRSPYRFEKLHLGKRPHIQIFTKSYLAFR
jgi:hypothetical protein